MALPSILSVFPNKFNKFNNTGARMQDSVCHMTFTSNFIWDFLTKTSRFRSYSMRRFYGCLHRSDPGNLHVNLIH